MTVAGMHAAQGARSRRATGAPSRRLQEIAHVASCLRGTYEALERNVRQMHDLPGYRFSDAAVVALEAVDDLVFEVEQEVRAAARAAEDSADEGRWAA